MGNENLFNEETSNRSDFVLPAYKAHSGEHLKSFYVAEVTSDDFRFVTKWRLGHSKGLSI